MKEMKFTKEIYNVVAENKNYSYRIVPAWTDHVISDEEAEANAKLIAAAPELLQSCIDLANELRHQLINHAMDLDVDEETAVAYAESFDIWKDAQKIIKKAIS